MFFEEINRLQYDKFKSKIVAEMHQKRENLSSHSFDSSNLKKSINLALNYALNLPLIWSSGDLEIKRAVQYMLFPDGLGYDFQNKQVRTFRVNSIFSEIASFYGVLKKIKTGFSKIILKNPV